MVVAVTVDKVSAGGAWVPTVGLRPDWPNPCVLGCLTGMARWATGDPFLVVRTEAYEGGRREWFVDSWADHLRSTHGPKRLATRCQTEAEALLRTIKGVHERESAASVLAP